MAQPVRPLWKWVFKIFLGTYSLLHSSNSSMRSPYKRAGLRLSPRGDDARRGRRPGGQDHQPAHWIGYTDVDSSGRGAGDGRAVYEGPAQRGLATPIWTILTGTAPLS